MYAENYKCLIMVARPPSTMLTRSDEKTYPDLPDLRITAFSFSPLSIIIAVDFV